MIACVMAVAVLALGLVGPNVWMLWTTRARVHDDVARVPHCKVALVLGCAPKLISGHENFYFRARMLAAAELVTCGKAERVLVSGGPLRRSAPSGNQQGSEADEMKEALIRLGVPANVIVVDPSGWRTRLSLQRAKALCADNRLTIVSQAFHTPRAVYLAHRLGILAHAFNAKAPASSSTRHLKVLARELFSRTRAFWER